jgi:hypothetical protein
MLFCLPIAFYRFHELFSVQLASIENINQLRKLGPKGQFIVDGHSRENDLVGKIYLSRKDLYNTNSPLHENQVRCRTSSSLGSLCISCKFYELSHNKHQLLLQQQGTKIF